MDDLPGTDHNQHVYLLRCRDCGLSTGYASPTSTFGSSPTPYTPNKCDII